jgi:hypothetical protein
MDEKGKVLFGYADGCIDGCRWAGQTAYSSRQRLPVNQAVKVCWLNTIP